MARETLVTQDPEDGAAAEKIVLPGVGHFQATQLLKDLGLTEATRERMAKGCRFWGFVLGCSGCMRGRPRRRRRRACATSRRSASASLLLFEGAELKSPHVGWNSLEKIRPDSRLLRGVRTGRLCTTRIRGERRFRRIRPR